MTVGRGYDLALVNEKDVRRILTNAKIDKEVIEKLVLCIGLKGEAARKKIKLLHLQNFEITLK